MNIYEASVGGRVKHAGAMLLGTVASGALVVGSLNGMAPANASCVSFFGIGTPGCTSSFGGIAIGFGDGAEADADGLGTFGFAIGANAYAGAFGPLNFAVAQGAESYALAGGFDAEGVPTGDFANVALNFGDFGNVSAGGPTVLVDEGPAGFGNLAVNLGNGGNDEAPNPNFVDAVGALNNAWNFQGAGNVVEAFGVINHASNTFGDDNVILSEGGTGLFSPGLNVAYNTFGNSNDVFGSPGPLAIVGALFVNGQNGVNAVVNTNFGIELRTPFSAAAPEQAATLDASKAMKSSTNSSVNRAKVKANIKSVRDNVKANVKSVRDNVKKALSGLKKKP